VCSQELEPVGVDRICCVLCCVPEEFVTPLSTPPSETEDTVSEVTARQNESIRSGLSESAIYDKIYET